MIHFVRLRTTFETLRRVQGYPRIYPPSVIFSKFINGVLRGLKTSRPRERERDTDIESYVGRQTNSLARSDQKGSLSFSVPLCCPHANVSPSRVPTSFPSSFHLSFSLFLAFSRPTWQRYTLLKCFDELKCTLFAIARIIISFFSLGLRVEDSFSFFI